MNKKCVCVGDRRGWRKEKEKLNRNDEEDDDSDDNR